ncbi:MAG TPA: hypothetical protein VK179_16725 [Bacteroidales bacterium]|nr:hypothetical protein [Bacteroidales bacterium]
MKISLYSCSLLMFMCCPLFSQINFQNKEGSELFETGTNQIRAGNFKIADSLLTMALCTFKDENVYFNRAAARLYEKDTLGACEDLNVAANRYYDVEATQLFHKHCCKNVDTIFYDRKFNKTDSYDYRYLEVIRTDKYTNNITGIYHAKGYRGERFTTDYGCDNSLVNLSARTTDIIGAYVMVDTMKVFTWATFPANCQRETEYVNMRQRGEAVLRAKYQNIKTGYNLEALSIVFEIIVSEKGNLLKAEYIGTWPEVELGENKANIENDLVSILSYYPKLVPAVFKGKKVKYKSYEFITF